MQETGQMLPDSKVHSIDSDEVRLSLCRDRSVATAVAVPIQPLLMQREVKPMPFVGPPTSSHNGIYISGPGLCGCALSLITAVDDRTLELQGCACKPFPRTRCLISSLRCRSTFAVAGRGTSRTGGSSMSPGHSCAHWLLALNSRVARSSQQRRSPSVAAHLLTMNLVGRRWPGPGALSPFSLMEAAASRPMRLWSLPGPIALLLWPPLVNTALWTPSVATAWVLGQARRRH